jgi:hypothetical protein
VLAEWYKSFLLLNFLVVFFPIMFFIGCPCILVWLFASWCPTWIVFSLLAVGSIYQVVIQSFHFHSLYWKYKNIHFSSWHFCFWLFSNDLDIYGKIASYWNCRVELKVAFWNLIIFWELNIRN